MSKKLIAAALLALGVASPASADLFKGKTIEVVSPAAAGGSYGVYALLLSDHLSRHLPGNPTVVPNYMGGAGGLKASNYVANVAKKDGTTLYVMHQNAPSSQLLTPEGAQYDAAKFEPIGILSTMNSVMAIRKDTGVKSVEDLKTTPVVIGSTGRGSYQFVVPTLLNEFYGAKFNIVTTYPGSADVMLAIERKEVGALMTSIDTIVKGKPEWTTPDGEAFLVMQVGNIPDPLLANVPTLNSLATDEESRLAFNFMSVANDMARALVMPAGTPPEAVAAMRKAFVDLMNDPVFQKAAADTGTSLNWTDHETLTRAIAGTLETPPAIIDKIKRYMAD
jgi:tripartite-type tricarboxylate transporter receptor subunit TctC